MRGDQSARQGHILRIIESRTQGATVAELAAQEGCHPRTIRRNLAAIQAAGFPLYFDRHGQKSRPAARESLSCLRRIEQTFHIDFEPLRKPVAEELSATAPRYAQGPAPMYGKEFWDV